MIPQQTFENYPVFGDNATKVKPDDAKYAAGFQQADVLPAEWMNWAWNKNTQGINELQAGLTSVEAEIGNVLANRNITPDGTVATQLLAALQSFKAEAILAAHPVGSLYWTTSNENPTVTFGGGTWKQIKDRFILAAGDTYTTIDGTGGAATVTLTSDQIPSHKHSYTPAGSVSVSSHTHSFTPSGSVSSTFSGTAVTSGKQSANHTHNITPSGTISGGTYKFTGTAGTTGKTQPTFTGTAVTSGENNRGHTHNMEHKHTTGGMSANETGTLTAGGTYGGNDRSAFISSTGNITLSESSNNGFDYATNMKGYKKMTISVAHTHTTNSMTNASGTAITNTGGESQTHTHSVTASGTVSNHDHSFTPAGTISVTANPTFTGSAVTSGSNSVDHTHSVTASGTVSSSFTGTAGTTGGTAPTFTGTAGTTGGTAPGATFTGTASNTGDTGGGQAHNNMPPYIIKYCWERTA